MSLTPPDSLAATAALPPAFLARPIAHRALHGAGRPENSLAAVRAAVGAGYGIEIDLQPSADGVAMVFHDEGLERLTGEAGPVAGRTAAELGAIRLTGGEEGIPTFAEVLALVAGRVPLLVEIKDQDGALGPSVGALEAAAARAAEGYAGPLAFMSFNPASVAAMAALAPGVPRGLTTAAFRADDWPEVPEARRARLREMKDLARTGAAFISHEAADLSSAPVARAKAAGLAVFCWTIRSPEAEAAARRYADNVTFEGYLP
ncbi:glycerophosphodiester phosphodiesterase family protein [Pseudoroseicyclus sp. CXY001]|uniref:glycerophosphodiester phosphodiesterase family protein n=1 Tax=Pseudoroseicyclus sp. CXY001 TaxID=3242492 RepID=UPI0035717810